MLYFMYMLELKIQQGLRAGRRECYHSATVASEFHLKTHQSKVTYRRVLVPQKIFFLIVDLLSQHIDLISQHVELLSQQYFNMLT